jgi:hypothetical protein
MPMNLYFPTSTVVSHACLLRIDGLQADAFVSWCPERKMQCFLDVVCLMQSFKTFPGASLFFDGSGLTHEIR